MDDLVDRIERLCVDHDRVVVGVAGSPGAGKSTIVAALAEGLAARGIPVATVPMDGFHLADVELERLGRRDRKGAIDTFDGYGYLALLRRLTSDADTTVYAPSFDRTTEEPVAGAIAIEPSARVILTEGNYLLDESEPWVRVRRELTEAWYVDADDEQRRRRLVQRHIEFGKDPEHARRWVADVDEVNAARIEASRRRADLVVRTDADQEPERRSRSASDAR